MRSGASTAPNSLDIVLQMPLFHSDRIAVPVRHTESSGCRDTMGNHQQSGSLSTSLMRLPYSPTVSPSASPTAESSFSAPAAPVTAAAIPSVSSVPVRRSSENLPGQP